MWFILFIGVGLFIAVYAYLNWNFKYWENLGVLAPKPKILFGNFSESGKRKCHMTDELTRIYNDFKGSANFVGIFQMRSPRILVLDPLMAKDILVKNFKHFKENEFSKMMDAKNDPLFSRNPFLSRGDEWKERRNEISPAFSTNRMKALYPLIENVCDRLTKFVKENIDEPFEARDLAVKFTTDAVANCVFGIEADSLQKDDSELRKMSKRLTKPSALTIIKIILTSIMPPLKAFMKVQFIDDEVNDFFMNIFNHAVDFRNNSKINRDDYLDYLIKLQKKKGFSGADLAGHSITFFSDGMETSSLLIAHMLYELGKNEKIQEKLRDEIANFSEDSDLIPFDVLEEMELLNQVAYETLRLHPPFTAISKECTEEIDLEYVKGKTVKVEKGMNVYIPLYQFQHDAEYHPKPKEFNPERFSKENGGEKAYRDRGLFFTFGDGSRFCIGMKFAMMQSKAAVVEIIRNFKVSVDEKSERDLVIDPNEFMNIKKGGLWLKFKPAKMFTL